MITGTDDNRERFRLFGLPSTRLGWWSIGLCFGFVALFAAWLLYVRATPIDRPTFFSDPLHAVLLLSAVAAAIAGGLSGVTALVLRRERSLMMLLSIIVGATVLYFTIAIATGE